MLIKHWKKNPNKKPNKQTKKPKSASGKPCLEDRNVWSSQWNRVWQSYKITFQKSTYFSSLNAPFCARRQNWLQFQVHLSELSAISSTLLLFGCAARLFQHVCAERRRCHLNMAKQNCDSLSRIRQTSPFGVRHTGCLRLHTPPDYLSACTAPALSWSHCSKITR